MVQGTRHQRLRRRVPSRRSALTPSIQCQRKTQRPCSTAPERFCAGNSAHENHEDPGHTLRPGVGPPPLKREHPPCTPQLRSTCQQEQWHLCVGGACTRDTQGGLSSL